MSQLVAAKRLVLTEDGRQVDVDASLELLGATADPSKAGVRERWAAVRAAQQASAAAEPPAAAAAPVAKPMATQPSLIDDAPAPAVAPPAPPARSEYQDARTLREQAEAEMAQIDLMKARGRVLEAESTLRAITDTQISVRTELMSFADRLTPLVAAESQPRKVWEIINVECERLAGRVQAAALRMAAQQRAEVTA